jgi:dUTP pyrophosphatase
MSNKKINCTVDFEDESFLPQYETEGAAGLDLRAWKYSLPSNLKQINDFDDKVFVLQPHERVLIKTGLHIELPQGIEAQLRPRSGLSLKHGIMAILGTIDEDYRGDVGIILLNTSNRVFEINYGDKLGQLVFNKIEKFDLQITTQLSDTNRGNKGFGSTGK